MAYFHDAYNPNPYPYTTHYDYSYDPPPPPDKNWVDPASVVRKYLNRIQKEFVKEEFKDLKNTSLYCLEVLLDSLEVNKDQELFPTDAKEINVHIKFPALDFVEVDDENSIVNSSLQTCKAKNAPSFTDLFQNIFSETRHHFSLEMEPVVEDSVDNIVNEEENSDVESEPIEQDVEPEPEPSSEDVTLSINRGKAALLVMTGLEMIQTLQRHPVTICMVATQTEATSEATTEATTEARLPEYFRQAVHKASRPEVTLPVMATTTESYPLWSGDGYQIGVANLTLTLTCLGSAVVNSLRGGTPETYRYGKAVFVRTYRNSSEGPDVTPSIIPIPKVRKVNFKTSKEILKCCEKDVVDSKANCCLLKKCRWLKMAQNSKPPEPEVERTMTKTQCKDLILDLIWKENCQKLLEEKRNNEKSNSLEGGLLKKHSVNLTG